MSVLGAGFNCRMADRNKIYKQNQIIVEKSKAGT